MANPTDPPGVQAARAEINQPPPIDVAWLRTVPIERLPAESRRLVMLADTLAAYDAEHTALLAAEKALGWTAIERDTLTARLAVVEGERDAARLELQAREHGSAATIKALAAEVAGLSSDIAAIVDREQIQVVMEVAELRAKVTDAAATERAAIVADLRSRLDGLWALMQDHTASSETIAYYQGAREARAFLADRYESNAHHEAP